MTYIVAGGYAEYRAYLDAKNDPALTSNSLRVNDPGSFLLAREPDVVLTNGYDSRPDWPQVQAELARRKAKARVELI